MQLTAREMKMVARLRKTERLWPRWRWAVLGAGIFAWAVYGYLALSICNRLQSIETGHGDAEFNIWLVGFAMLWPKCLIGITVGACLIGFAIKDWRGNTNRALLLKLIDAEQTQADSHGPDA